MTETRHQNAVDRFGKYVKIIPVVMQDEPDAHAVYFVSGNQSFNIASYYGTETREEAEWVRDMFCVALARVVDEQ